MEQAKGRKKLHRQMQWYHCLPLFAGLLAVFHVVMTIWGEKYLYCDGTNYLFSLVTTGQFHVYPLGRSGFDYLVQWPVVLAYRLGCRSLPAMGLLYGLGISILPALEFFITIWLLSYLRNRMLTYLLFLLDTSVLLVWGFFVQLESVLGFLHFLLLLVLLLSREDFLLRGKQTPRGSDFVRRAAEVYLVAGSAICFHLNEYYCFWSLILAFVLGMRLWQGRKQSRDEYRVFAKIVDGLLLIWHIFVAITSYTSISARGTAPGVWEALRGFLQHKFLVVVVLLLAFFVGLEIVKQWLGSKGQEAEGLCYLWNQICSLVASVYVLFCGGYILLRAHHIANFGTGARFTLFAGGGILGILLILVHFLQVRGNPWFADFSRDKNLRWLCFMQTILLCLFMVKTAGQYREYDTILLTSCREQAVAGGTVLCEAENPLKTEETLKYYYWAWTMPPQSLLVQGIRGETQIECVAQGDGFYEYDGKPEAYPDFSQYGITLSVRE